jgi:hypothetical protein
MEIEVEQVTESMLTIMKAFEAKMMARMGAN